MSTALRPRPAATTAETGRGSAFTGTGALTRFMLRRDRVRIPLWVAGLTLAPVASATSFAELYPTAADREILRQTMDSPAMVAMAGVNPSPADYGYGVMVNHQLLWLTAILAGLMSVLLLVRHTRTEEATGRAELVRASVVGRHAGTTAALLVVAIANAAVTIAITLALGSTGIEGMTWGSSALFGLAHAAVGLVFAGVAAVTVQVTEHPRAAAGMALAVLGTSYALRAVGDLTGGALSWLSPIGWAQATRVYADDRWWPLLLALAVAAALVAGATSLGSRRDVGAGLRRPRPGPARASSALTTPLGFAVRLHRSQLAGWLVALFLLGVAYGSVLGEAEQMLSDIEALEGMLPATAGVSVAEGFAAMITSVVAIVASIGAVLATLKLRSEEEGGRGEALLATALSRTRWAMSHIVVAAAGGAVLLAAAGLGMGLAGAASMGDAGLVVTLTGGSLAYAPALWVVVATAVLLYGVRPRAAHAVWILVVYSFFVVYLGRLLELPEWMANLSPFGHVPQLPVEELAVVPLLLLTVLAGALLAGGLAGLRRRDMAAS